VEGDVSIDIGPGFYDAVDFEDYASIDAYNGSSIVHMERSPLHYRWAKDHPEPPTPAMILGTITHRMILEPDRIGDFVVWGDKPDQKVRNGAKWEAFKEEYAGHTIITKTERDTMVGMAVAVRRNPAISELLRDGRSELSMVWKDTELGHLCKGRVDYLRADPLILDLKTTTDARPFKFGNQAFRLGYHIKLAMYQDGYFALTGELAPVKIIAVENKPPYDSAVYFVPSDVLQQGHEDYIRLMRRIRECEETGCWPGAVDGEAELSLPTYAYSEASDDLSDLELVS
jgi:exodeoxyribonuclease VIII